MKRLRRANHWFVILLSLSTISLLFQNCSKNSGSSSPTNLPQVNLIYAESISQLNLRNNTESVDVKDAYLYVGNIYSVGFLNHFIRNGAELTIEVESSSTAMCSLNRVTTSKQAFIGSCSQQGLLDLKITFNNPGQPTSIEKRHFFVINKTAIPKTRFNPVSIQPNAAMSDATVE